jgi:hypothetical protein
VFTFDVGHVHTLHVIRHCSPVYEIPTRRLAKMGSAKETFANLDVSAAAAVLTRHEVVDELKRLDAIVAVLYTLIHRPKWPRRKHPEEMGSNIRAHLRVCLFVAFQLARRCTSFHPRRSDRSRCSRR